MITTDDDAIADRLRVLRNQGMRARYQYEMRRPQLPADRPAGGGRHSAARPRSTRSSTRRQRQRRNGCQRGPAPASPGLDVPRDAAGPHARVAPVHGAASTPTRRSTATSSSPRLTERRRRVRASTTPDWSSTTTATATTPGVVTEDVPVAERMVAPLRSRCPSTSTSPTTSSTRSSRPSAEWWVPGWPVRRSQWWARARWARCTPASLHNSARADPGRVVEPREEVGRAVADRFGAAWAPDLAGGLDGVDAVVVAAATRGPPRPRPAGDRGRAADARGEAGGRRPGEERRRSWTPRRKADLPLMCGLLERYNPRRRSRPRS